MVCLILFAMFDISELTALSPSAWDPILTASFRLLFAATLPPALGYIHAHPACKPLLLRLSASPPVTLFSTLAYSLALTFPPVAVFTLAALPLSPGAWNVSGGGCAVACTRMLAHDFRMPSA